MGIELANPIFNFRMDPAVIAGIKDHADRRGVTTSEYLRPLLTWASSLDYDDPVWPGLAMMTFPKVPKAPIPRN